VPVSLGECLAWRSPHYADRLNIAWQLGKTLQHISPGKRGEIAFKHPGTDMIPLVGSTRRTVGVDGKYGLEPGFYKAKIEPTAPGEEANNWE
jgi:hypothetical protein